VPINYRPDWALFEAASGLAAKGLNLLRAPAESLLGDSSIVGVSAG
jgi:hypothetical protein